MKTRLHFSRFEFKYILPADLRRDLESEFQYFVDLDPYVATKPGKRYMVRSLYYDNAAFVNYYEKTDGIKHRSKFRLRTYTDDPNETCPQFIEIKGRHNNLVFKHRTGIDLSRPRAIEPEGALDPTTADILGRIDDGPIKTQFRYELERKGLEPVMLVDYWRRPYVSKYDPEFRMTFDEQLKGTASRELFPNSGARTRVALPGYTILEVKFRFHVPKWFHRLIQTMELRRVSISKYCASIEAHGLAEKLD